MKKFQKKVAIVGTVGLPAAYSGFETLSENLVRFHEAMKLPCEVTIYCSKFRFKSYPKFFHGARLVYIPLDANGPSSILYDVISLFFAVLKKSDVILLLGVSGAIALPLIRIFSRAKIITNIDGIEWKRQKWQGLAKWILRISEWFAVKFSHVVVADNQGIVEHVQETYNERAIKISYGGDHALLSDQNLYDGPPLPPRYALALCRIEPENNVEMIIEAFANNQGLPLVFIGNWGNSSFGRSVRERYNGFDNVHLLDPIYKVETLYYIRKNTTVYLHGHSAGGTNPSLVEMMHFGLPILAFDCNFNRYTTEGAALYFKNAFDIGHYINCWDSEKADISGKKLCGIASEQYVWRIVAEQYFDLMDLK